MADIERPEDRAVNAEVNREAAEAERDAAWNVAANEAANRDLAEKEAVDSRIAAGQAYQTAREMDTDRRVLSSDLARERAAASSNAFGFYLTLGILVAALLVGGFYLYWRSTNPDNVVINASSPAPAPNPPVVVQPAPPVINTPPPVVNVTPPTNPPPTVNNRINVPPANPPTDNGTGGANGTGANGTENGAGTGTGTNGTSGSGGGAQ